MGVSKQEMDDFEFIVDILDDFFKDSSIRKKLKAIQAFDKWGGFERWWQIEFAIFLEKLKGSRVKDFIREARADVRQNCGSGKLRVHFDFRIKRPNGRKFLCLELKCNKKYKTCISHLDNDWDIYFEARKKDKLKDKELFFVGIYSLEGYAKIDSKSENVKKYILGKYEKDIGENLNVQKIGCTGLGYFVY